MPLALEFLLGLILLLAFAFPYLIPLAIAGWVFLKFHEEIISFLVRVPIAIWQLHLTLGEKMVQAVRDYPVREHWKDNYSKSWIMRLAIIIWLVIIPVFNFTCLIFLRMFIREVETAAGILKLLFFLSLLVLVLTVENDVDGPKLAAAFIFSILVAFITPWSSATVIIYGYYRYYWRGPLTHYRLVDFDKELYMMWADAQVALTVQPIEIRFWWITKTRALKHWFENFLNGEKNE